MTDSILIVDDEPGMRQMLEVLLKKEGYAVSSAGDGETALATLGSETIDLALVDLMLPGLGGMEVLRRAHELPQEPALVMMTAYASTRSAVEAMKAGAVDYVMKPFDVDELKLVVRNALDRRRLARENLLLRRELGEKFAFGNLVGSAPKMLQIYDLVRRVAGSRTTVLITGENGTGKELVARALHYNGGRKDRPFVAVNCSAIPAGLIESELFGHTRGAFTGAIASRQGLLEAADGGTLFLDEVAEMPPELQVKLLRILQDRTFRPVGSTEDRSADVRIVAASNRDVEGLVREGAIREDFYYRLNVVRIHLPPLRERAEEIPALVEHFLEKVAKSSGAPPKKISREALDLLRRFSFPGNIRQLENLLERAVALSRGEMLLPEDFEGIASPKGTTSDLPGGEGKPSLPLDFNREVSEYEKHLLQIALGAAGGVKTRAAQLLGLSFRSLRYLLTKYKLGSD